jgi:hypothetical protein
MKTTDQPITKRQEDILVLLYLYRFLDRTQIQQFLRHKSKSYVISLLADLRAKDYIQGIYYKSFADNIKPAIYFVSLAGIRYLKARGDCSPSVLKRLYAESQTSEDFTRRCILRAEIALELAAADPSLGAFDFTTPSGYAEAGSICHFLVDSPIAPDLVVIREKEGEHTSFLIEIWPDSLPSRAVATRLRQYEAFADSGDWTYQLNLDLPRLLICCGTRLQIVQAKRLLSRIRNRHGDTSDLQIEFILADDIYDDGILPRLAY